MTETKTFAQRRLIKLLESYKEARKHRLSNLTPSLKSCQRSGDDSNKKTCPKRDTNSRALFSQGKANERNTSSSILKSLNKNELSSSHAGMECQQIDSIKDVAVSQQILKSRNQQKPQSWNNKSISLERGVKQSIYKCQQSETVPSLASRKEAVLKRVKNAKQFNNNERNKECQETLQQVAEKRRYDHENFEKKKIMKNKKCEDSSKNIENKKGKKEQSIVTGANMLGVKLSSIIDSYTTMDDRSPPSEKGTKNKTEDNCYQVKEPFNNNKKSIKFSITRNKDSNLKVKDKEIEIKNKEKIKQLSVTSPLKTKLQARLQKVKADMKEKRKGIKKESSVEKVNIKSMEDNSRFIESMDWEPSNDFILRSIRDEVDPAIEIMEWQYICDSDYNIGQEINDSSLYIVVDTNVLIRNIELIIRLSKATMRGFKIIQVIPWQVLKELDNLKTKVDHKNVNASARKAIHFLSDATNSDQFNVVFQSQSKHFKECPAEFVVEVPDDHLIKCCYQLKQKGHKVLLLSNDVNLRVKTNTNNILAVDDKWIIKILDQESKSKKPSIHCFEKNPEECQTGNDDNNSCSFAHKTTVVTLSCLYNIVLLKYKEKYNGLWPLWVPKEPHFPELINFMTSSSYFQPYWVQLNFIKDFFIKNKSYDNIKPAEIEKLGRHCIKLMKSMCSDNFIPNDLALQFFKDLSFLKCFPVLDWSDFNYIEGSYRLAQKYLKDTEDSLNEFVSYIRALYAEKGSSLYRNEDVLYHIEVNLNLIKQFRSAFSQFQLTQEISEDSEIAVALHKAICDFLGEKMDFSRFPIFSPEDIVEYVNPNRNIFIPALSWLINQESSLTEIKSKIV